MRSRTRALTPVLALGLAVAVSACGGSDDDTSAGADDTTTTTVAAAAAPQSTPGTNIIIKDFVFKPQEMTAKVGDTITVKNDDGTVHTVTDKKSGGFDTGNLGGGETKTFKVDKAGTFDYRCDIHTYMTGTITVS